MRPLTIIYITARKTPCVAWMLDSLLPQVQRDDHIEVIIVDSTWNGESVLSDGWEKYIPFRRIQTVSPKPCVWQGRHRLTKEDWWAASNARNTGICLCKTEWIAFLDDRCVLAPTWLQSVREAMNGNYAVCGAYEKRIGMVVCDGVIVHDGSITGTDNRLGTAHGQPTIAPGQWFYGCTTALPLEWELNVNGYEELMDGLGFEDVIHGMHLANSKYPIKYDPRMMVIQDRSLESSGPVMKKTDKGVSPHDKSHASLERFGHLVGASHPWNLREIRDKALKDEPFPDVSLFPTTDWYDGVKISEM